MGYSCDFCGEQRSMIYCRSDAACLCLSCDRNVHSANALSKRHSRTLICEKCNTEPASVRCVEEKLSLCQNCNWSSHAPSTSASTHKRQSINCYSGCPSAAELASIWSFAFDNADTKVAGDSEETDVQNIEKLIQNLDQLPESSKESPETCEVRNEDTNMDDGEDLNRVDYDGFFGMTMNHSQKLFENGGIGSLFGTKAMSATDSIDSLYGTKTMSAADSNCQSAAAEVSSAALANTTTQPAYSNDSTMSTKTEPILPSAASKAIHSSGVSRENVAKDYQDCGVSSAIPMGEPPWSSPHPDISFQLQSTIRTDAVNRYRQKKKERKFEKQVRYTSRKERADVRRRVKGRFVKAGEAYDYDPLSDLDIHRSILSRQT